MLVAQVVEVVEVMEVVEVVEVVVEVLNGVRPNGHRSRLALRARETDLAFASYMEGCGSNDSDYDVVCSNDHKMLAMHMSEAVNLKSRGSLKPGCALMHCPHYRTPASACAARPAQQPCRTETPSRMLS